MTAHAIARDAVQAIATKLGHPLSAADAEVLGEAVVQLVGVLGSAAAKKAEAAGEAAAARITTADEAEQAQRNR